MCSETPYATGFNFCPSNGACINGEVKATLFKGSLSKLKGVAALLTYHLGGYLLPGKYNAKSVFMAPNFIVTLVTRLSGTRQLLYYADLGYLRRPALCERKRKKRWSLPLLMVRPWCLERSATLEPCAYSSSGPSIIHLLLISPYLNPFYSHTFTCLTLL